MKQTLNIVDAIEEELSRLESVLGRAAKIDQAPDGKSEIARIKALIADLRREIELNTPLQ